VRCVWGGGRRHRGSGVIYVQRGHLFFGDPDFFFLPVHAAVLVCGGNQGIRCGNGVHAAVIVLNPWVGARPRGCKKVRFWTDGVVGLCFVGEGGILRMTPSFMTPPPPSLSPACTTPLFCGESNQAKPREKKPFVPGGEPRRTRIAALGRTMFPHAAHLLAQSGHSSSAPSSRNKDSSPRSCEIRAL
jgi:hypothetical protein